tara:strand:+ start:121 stop:609 length:489 start_codon:yes stop_codon:yes gene_type:complete
MDKAKHKKGAWIKHILVWGFVVAGLVDIITAVMAVDLGRETNPVYLFGAGIWGLAALKLVFLSLTLWVAYKSRFRNELVYFIFVMFLFYAGALQAWAASTNIEALQNYEYYEAQPIPTEQEMTEYYKREVNTRYVNPLFNGIILFLLYQWTRPHVKIKRRFK